jgi:hypothetical protein
MFLICAVTVKHTNEITVACTLCFLIRGKSV